MNKTGIEYLDFSWNPLAMRCTPVSAGCAHCWHLVMADRMAANPMISDELRAAYAGETRPVLAESRLLDPIKRRKPARIGVQFMGDLFHEDVPFEVVDRVFEVMAAASQHTFLVLTKRPRRMQAWFWTGRSDRTHLPNVWLGVTVENRGAALERIPALLRVPAAVHFVSCEPLLSDVYLDLIGSNYGRDFDGWSERIDWVIVGGESGPGARPMLPEWVQWIRDDCEDASVPFFFKQWGEWFPRSQWEGNPYLALPADENCIEDKNIHIIEDEVMHRVGKHDAGRRLDGLVWDEYPV